jgi:hypothetical protein
MTNPPPVRHNQPTFDEIVQESLARGLLLTIKDAYTTLSRDPRAERRHFRVLAEIIDCLNFNEINARGMAWPGRNYLARQSADVMRPDGYSVATIAKTIAELLAWGYLAHNRRAPPSGGRALSHYTVRRPSIEDLRSEIDAWVRAQRRRPAKRPFPGREGSQKANAVRKCVEERPRSDNPADDDPAVFVSPPDGELPLFVNDGELPLFDKADGECVLPADGECGLPTGTSNRGTRRESAPTPASENRGGLHDGGGTPTDGPAPPDEIELAVASYNDAAFAHGFTPCGKLTPHVRKRLEKRIGEIGGLAEFDRAVSAIPLDDFLAGRVRPEDGRRPFKLNLERLLRTDGGMGDVLALLLGLADEAARSSGARGAAQRHELSETLARMREEEDRGTWQQ